jgi:hypothetical protein
VSVYLCLPSACRLRQAPPRLLVFECLVGMVAVRSVLPSRTTTGASVGVSATRFSGLACRGVPGGDSQRGGTLLAGWLYDKQRLTRVGAQTQGFVATLCLLLGPFAAFLAAPAAVVRRQGWSKGTAHRPACGPQRCTWHWQGVRCCGSRCCARGSVHARLLSCVLACVSRVGTPNARAVASTTVPPAPQWPPRGRSLGLAP